MSEELLYLIFIVILQLAMLGYFYIKDKENTLKIDKAQAEIEGINKALHYLRAELEIKRVLILWIKSSSKMKFPPCLTASSIKKFCLF